MTLVARRRPAAGEPEGLLVLFHGRGADEYDLEPLFDILDPEQRQEVVLVGAAAVEEDERAVRLTRGRAGSRLEAQRAAQVSRGFVIGVSTGSTCSRRCSKSGGNERCSPSVSSGSSVVKPGPMVAISKSTPLGSRK